MTDSEQLLLLNQTQADINRLALAAFERLQALLKEGKTPRDAIALVQSGFIGAYESALLAAFNQVLMTAIGIAELRAMTISGLTLSQKLYRHSQAVQSTVLNIVNDHAKGFHDARRLALQLYEGYGFRADEPLKVKAPLPKYFRAAFGDEKAFDDLWNHHYVGSKLAELADFAEVGPELAQWYARIQASNLKTPALKAAFMEALDALEQGAGAKVLAKKLSTAFYERNRYFANRIAQTELHRAYTDTRAAELMADTGFSAVLLKLSSTHPKTDICDYFANVDAYGLGKGIYPKAHAPKPPLHPFCRCVLTPLAAVDGAKAKLKPNADRDYLASLPLDQARQVMGSADKLNQALGGVPVVEVFDTGKDALYKLKRLGEFAQDQFNGAAFVNFDMKTVQFTRDRKALLENIALFVEGKSPEHQIIAAVLDEKTQQLLSANSKVILFSKESLDAHLLKHPEITAKDYQLIPDIIEKGELYLQKEKRYALLYKNGRLYRAAIKTTASGEVYFLSLFATTEELANIQIRNKFEKIR